MTYIRRMYLPLVKNAGISRISKRHVPYVEKCNNFWWGEFLKCSAEVYTFLFISKIHPHTEIKDQNLNPSKVVTFLYIRRYMSLVSASLCSGSGWWGWSFGSKYQLSHFIVMSKSDKPIKWPFEHLVTISTLRVLRSRSHFLSHPNTNPTNKQTPIIDELCA